MVNKNYTFNQIKFINFIHLSTTQKEIVRQWRNHPTVAKWMNNQSLINKKEHNNFFEKLNQIKTNQYWLVCQKNKFIGVVYLNKINLEAKFAYIGIYLNPNLLNLGWGTKLLTILIKIAFQKIKLNFLLLEVDKKNFPAINLYTKLGFFINKKLISTMKKNIIMKNVNSNYEI